MKHTSILGGGTVEGPSLRELLGYVPREQLEQVAVDVCGQVAEHVWDAMPEAERPHAYQAIAGVVLDLSNGRAGAGLLGWAGTDELGWADPQPFQKPDVCHAIGWSRFVTRELAPAATTPELIAQIDAWACPTTDESGPPGHLNDAQRLALRERVQLLASEAVAGGAS